MYYQPDLSQFYQDISTFKKPFENYLHFIGKHEVMILLSFRLGCFYEF